MEPAHEGYGVLQSNTEVHVTLIKHHIKPHQHVCSAALCAVLTYLQKYIHAYIQTSIHYIHTYIHTCVHTYIHTYVHTYIRTCIHICVHTYIDTHAFLGWQVKRTFMFRVQLTESIAHIDNERSVISLVIDPTTVSLSPGDYHVVLHWLTQWLSISHPLSSLSC